MNFRNPTLHKILIECRLKYQIKSTVYDGLLGLSCSCLKNVSSECHAGITK